MKITHGYYGTPTYNAWASLRRLHRADMCAEWADFRNFLTDMGEKPNGKAVRRIDASEKYQKSNCEWAHRRGKNSPAYKHGRKHTKTYRYWEKLNQASTNPNAKNFRFLKGAMPPEWRSFEQFLCDVGEKPEGTYLRRLDKNAPFSKENSEWAVPSGTGGPNYRHGKTGTSTYHVWASMINRTTSKKCSNYHRYGGRGITVCEKWRTFAGFYEDMGDRPDNLTLERVDNNKGYTKENCKWATTSEQAKNRRSAVMLTVGSTTIQMCDLCEMTGIDRATLRYADRRGYLEELIERRTRKDQ